MRLFNSCAASAAVMPAGRYAEDPSIPTPIIQYGQVMGALWLAAAWMTVFCPRFAGAGASLGRVKRRSLETRLCYPAVA